MRSAQNSVAREAASQRHFRAVFARVPPPVRTRAVKGKTMRYSSSTPFSDINNLHLGAWTPKKSVFLQRGPKRVADEKRIFWRDKHNNPRGKTTPKETMRAPYICRDSPKLSPESHLCLPVASNHFGKASPLWYLPRALV